MLSISGHRLAVAEARPESFEGVDVALFSAGATVSGTLAPAAAGAGAVVIDNSSRWRMEPGVPLVVPEVNAADAATHEGIIANPNCSTMQLVPLLAALRDAAGLERVVVDTYQAVSGSGHKAVAELQAQVEAHVGGRAITASVYPHAIAFNVLPQVDVFLDDGYTREEWKVIHESRKILHLPELRLSCTAVRVPVFTGHSEAVHVELREPLDPDQAREAFAAVPGVVVVDEPAASRYPLATEAAGQDQIFVGRVRRDVSVPDGRGLAFWVVSDNLRKGAATNAVQIAELVAARGWLAPASRRAGRAA
jgi:aspartate-semialdehyde dehydrogenase